MKCYVLDTNVLIQTPASMDVFEENQIVIPLVVVEELDRLKTAEGEKGANARKAIRRLENLRQTGDLLEGVMLENGGSLWNFPTQYRTVFFAGSTDAAC